LATGGGDGKYYIRGVANEPKRPQKRRGESSGRVTPKGGPVKSAKSSSSSGTPGASSRYTPPVPAYKKVSPPWWPATMFVPWGLGIVMIILNYVQLLPGSVSNWYVLGGLGLILAGIIAATQYH
jgi:hypothetical protein